MTSFSRSRTRFVASLVAVAALSMGSITFGNVSPASAAVCGSGTSYGALVGGKYQISSADHLVYLSQTSSDWGADFVQTADIDLASCTDWEPVGRGSTAFTGTYDGGGLTIDNFYMNTGLEGFVALFGLTNGATISNLTVKGAVTNTYSFALVGGVVGKAEASTTITKVKSEVDVTTDSRNYSGGIVGSGESSASLSYSGYAGTLTNNSSDGNLAGLSGNAANPISDSYSIATFGGSNATLRSGLNGWNGTVISNSFSAGTGSTAGISETTPSGSNNFWDNTIGPSTATRTTTPSGFTGKSTSEMKTLSTYTTAGWKIVDGWDTFDPSSNKVWGICPLVNDGYPFLLWEYTSNPCGVAASSTSSGLSTGGQGIFLAVNGVLVGKQVSGAPVYFGSASIRSNSPYSLSVQSVVNSALSRTVLATGTANARGHLYERVLLGALNPGSYKIVMTGIHASGYPLVLTNYITVGANGSIVSVSAESQQPFLN